MDWNTILAALMPILLDVLGAIVLALIGQAALWLKRRTGIEIEARHREALHQAIMTGLRAALTKSATPSDAITRSIEYAKQSVPYAIRALRPSDQILTRIATAKLEEAMGKR